MSWSDPLYRPRAALPGSATLLDFAGVPAAVSVVDTDPSSAQAQWMPDREIVLVVTDDVGPDALAAVLPHFLAHAESLADRPAEASLSLPSRDVDRARVARAAGLLPTGVQVIADLRRPGPAIDAGGTGGTGGTVVVRDAAAADAAAVARLWCEQADYEARVGTLRVTPAIRAAIQDEAAAAVSGPSTVLVAEAAGERGTVIAMVVAEADSPWAGTRTVLEPVSYLAVASTTAGARGSGAGAALVAELHRRHRASGITASTLHYSAYNPLSVPFWSQRGYRPLVTSFSRPIG